MSSTSRQNSLLVAEDWKKIYQTFRDADFQSYDFETLRKSMIDYLRLYYPEDFNDFVESSEYIALIDLIAFLGQSLAFRTDLNARENFLDTAERRDSVLKLARLVSYNPKRCIPASGLLKINAVSTSEVLTDSNGINLSNLTIAWNDSTNGNWQEQFSTIMNATLINSQLIGKSGNSQTINGIRNDEYTINIPTSSTPVFPFSLTTTGKGSQFEVVSATSSNQPYVYELEPRPAGKFNVLYRNDNQGNSSNNTGFFMLFKEGTTHRVDFNLQESIPNRVLNVQYNQINNTDIWLYSLDSNLVEKDSWKKVPAVAGVNAVYNKMSDRNLYEVATRAGDQINLVFGDGSFSTIPQGNFRLYFRVSNGMTYKITPDEMQGIQILINYVSRVGKSETLTLHASLNYTVTNATASETTNEIREKAPQQYYTQGRMITGEDYNIFPYTTFSSILKVKSLNRISSGISRYLDVDDSSGKYSSTNIFAKDGVLYKEETVSSTSMAVVSSSNVQQLLQTEMTTVLNSKEMQHFYYANFTRQTPPVWPDLPLPAPATTTDWRLSSLNTSGCSGYFVKSSDQSLLQLGYVTSNSLRYARPGSVIKFKAKDGFYFNSQNRMIAKPAGYSLMTGETEFLYSSIVQVVGDGTNGNQGSFANGQGPVTLSQTIPNGSQMVQIIPVFKNVLPDVTLSMIVTKVLAFNNFGLRYDIRSETWYLISESDLDKSNPFSLAHTGDTTGQGIDASWMIRFEYTNNVGYKIYWRGLNYAFESLLETKFYFDNKVRIYDSKTSTVINDRITVLGVNPSPDSASPLGVNYSWTIYKNIVDPDGFENQNKVFITFTDDNTDGIPDNPDLFDLVVDPGVNTIKKLTFFQKSLAYRNFVQLIPIDASLVNTEYQTLTELEPNISQFLDGQIFYAATDAKFYRLATVNSLRVVTETAEYEAKVGRESLMFQYRHNSPNYRRIDPSPNNIIDIYTLTKSYANDYQIWIKDTTNKLSEPIPPTTEQLYLEYGKIEDYKAISDTLVFSSARFKPLFGTKAPSSLRATFKVVKNPALNISDNDIKSSVVGAINTYFSVDNWDFGETFYFSELSAYLHATLSPSVSSIIIVPTDSNSMFGHLYQINAESNEILTSAATVDNVEVISAITAATINVNLAGLNNTSTLGII